MAANRSRSAGEADSFLAEILPFDPFRRGVDSEARNEVVGHDDEQQGDSRDRAEECGQRTRHGKEVSRPLLRLLFEPREDTPAHDFRGGVPIQDLLI